ncbi:MAG: TolA-binding protein [Planctomycetota bacterium]
MKKIIIICSLFIGVAAFNPAVAQDSTVILNENESHSIFTGFFKSVWVKLKSLNPTQKQAATVNRTYTAGIRGAEATDTLLKPYWKDDLTQDENFQKELQQFSLAQLKLDQGELQSAVESFDGFLDQYRQSSLRPNALFGKSISLAGLGKKSQSVTSLELFVSENPNHPLVVDAQEIIKQLN